MKYCNYCGKEVVDEAVFCPGCGCSLDKTKPSTETNIKYCSHCGQEVNTAAVVCIHCGCSLENKTQAKNYDTTSNKNNLYSVAKIFMIIGTIASAFFYLIPLAWTIPMTVSFYNKVNNNEKISVGFKVCSLLFVNTIAGILMLCANEDEQN
ncbi:MAG: zinc-ribbon domain-containing protein [Christensenellales bacterium]